MKNCVGSPVEGEDFYGREKELKLAWEMIEDGNSLILAAPRRIGKTSFSKKLLTIAEEKGWVTLYLDLEGIQSEHTFIERFTDDLIKKDVLSNTIDKVKSALSLFSVKAGNLALEWNAQKNDIYEKLIDAIDPNKETLIVIDELAIFLTYLIKDNGDVVFFLNWLRSLRQLKSSKIRWIFCSSIGIDNFLSIHRLSNTMNDVDSFLLAEMKRDESAGLLKALGESRGIDLTDGQINYILDKLGWELPYFIQILFSEIYRLNQLNDEIISNVLIDKAYSSLIDHKYFNTWDERLKEYSDLEENTRMVLKRICQVPKGEKRENLHTELNKKIRNSEKADEVLSKILRILINDGYLMETERNYGFRSPLLRDFWYNRFVL